MIAGIQRSESVKATAHSTGRSSAFLLRRKAEAALIFANLASGYLLAGLFDPAARLKAKAERFHGVILADISSLTDVEAGLIEPTITELEVELNRLASADIIKEQRDYCR